MPLSPSTRLGRYEIQHLLGAGGMGEVYLAEDTHLERKVALKILPAEVGQNAERMQRFVREAKAASALNHPNIAHVYEIGESEGTNFIAMEFIEGESLRAKIHRERVDLRRLLKYLAQAADGLAKAHAAGIVHRDLKPDNIMISADGYAKILDFGLAKLIKPPRPSGAGADEFNEAATAMLPQPLSSPGVVMGTVGYMSPEQAQGRREIDQRSDIFSFGCILYEAATRRQPFAGATAVDSLHKIIHAQPPPIKEFNADAPADLQRVVRRCLQKDPEERYQTIKDVAIELKELRREMEGAGGVELSVSPESAADPHGSEAVGRTAGDGDKAEASTAASAPRSTSSAEYLVGEIKRHKTGAAVAVALLALVAAGVGYGIYRWTAKQSQPAPSFPSAKFQRLTTSGRASGAAISPDGKWVAHVKSDAGQQSLWLRQVETTSDTQIVAPSTQNYFGVTFSKDGNYIYYALGEPTIAFSRTLYQVPTLGGASRKVTENITSPVSLSTDGTRLAFTRVNPMRGETALVVANADGTGERQVAVRKLPDTFSTGGPSWSPDGKLIALGVINYDPGSGWASATVVEVQVESGAERPITSQKWSNVGKVAWLPNGSGLVLIAAEQGLPGGFQRQGFSSSQIWHLSYPDGETRKITNDLNNYSRVSLTADSSAMVTVQSDTTSNVWVAPQGDASRAKQVSSGRYDGQLGLSWMPGGRIVYTSRESGVWDIWSMDPDGKNQKQLTANARYNYYPWATSDGRYIIFISTRRGAARSIWRMDTDGGNLKQLTDGPGDVSPQSSPDGRWVVFHSLGSGAFSVWKVSIDGGEPARLTDRFTLNPTVSPDGSLIACFYREDQPNAPFKVAIIPFAGGDPVEVFDAPPGINGPAGLRWTPDGRALTFIDTTNGVSNIWSLPVDGGTPKQLTDFKTDQIFWFDFSRDGRQLALSRGTQTSDVILIRDFR